MRSPAASGCAARPIHRGARAPVEVQALWLNERLHAYPFSRFALFAVVRAKQPYHLHQTYELPGGHLEALGAGAPTIDAWLAQPGP